MSVNLNEPTVVAPQSPAQPPTGAQDTAQPALFKKAGGDWTKANDSYFNAVNKLTEVSTKLNETATMAQQYQQRAQQLEQALAMVAGGGQPVSNDPLAAIQSELGLPVEPLRAGIRSEVNTALQEMLSPVLNRYQAEEQLATEVENFEQLRGQARQFMRENAEVADTFNAVVGTKPAQAWKYAIREMLVSQGGHPSVPPNVSGAGLPGGRSASVGRSEPAPGGQVPDETRYNEAIKYSRDFGDNGPMVHERLKGTSVQRAVAEALQRVGLAPPTE